MPAQATETNERGVNKSEELGTAYVSGLLRLCPVCKNKLSQKIIHAQATADGMRFTNREICLDIPQLETGRLVRSPCEHDVIIGTIVVTAEMLRGKISGTQDTATVQQKSEQHRMRLQLESPKRYWCWLGWGKLGS